MRNKGFTLVELLTVLVILSLLMTIAIPASLAVSSKIKQRMLKSKITLAEQAAVLWAQDHKNCFTSSCNEINTSNCTVEDNKTICPITIELLAADNLFDYDEGLKVLNPADKSTCINNYGIKISYNNKNRTFAASADPTKQDASCPQ